MDSFQNIFRSLSANAFLRDVNLEIASILRALPKAASSIQDAVSDAKKPDDLPDVIILDIHGLNGEHAYLANTSLPPTVRKFSYSPIQLFEEGVDQDRFAKVATRLLDEVVEATLSKSRDYILVFLASDIGASILKMALHQASKSTDPKYYKILAKTSLLVFFGAPHRESASQSWQTTLFKLLWKLYPNHLGSWSQSKLEELASLHKHIASCFQNLGCRCRIVSYYQDNPVDAEYDLISPRYTATLDWNQEVRIAAHKQHNLIGDFYTPKDQRYLRELIQNIRVERQPEYKSCHSQLAKMSQTVVPLQMVHAIFEEFCDWLFMSNPSFRSWAVDSPTSQPSSETNDSTALAHTNSAKQVLEKGDRKLGSPNFDDYLLKHGQDYPKRPKSSITKTFHTLSIGSCDRTCNSAILHSSLVGAIQSQRSSLGFQNDCFINLPGCSSAQQQITTTHLISSLCKQLLSHQPTLVSSIQHLLQDIDAMKEGSNSNLTEKLVWGCLVRLLQTQTTDKTFLFIYKPTDPRLSISYSTIYHKIIQIAESVELRIKLLYIRQPSASMSETDFADPIVETTIPLNGEEAIASINKDIMVQLNAATTHDCFTVASESTSKVLSFLSTNPLDGPIFCALMSRKAIASSFFLEHGAFCSQKGIFSVVFDSIPLSQRSSVVAGLVLLTCGTRPLAVSEFGAALLASADISSESMRYARFLADDVIYFLCGLIEIRDGFVCIAHAGLADFIVDANDPETRWYSISIPKGHEKLAHICLKSIMASGGQDAMGIVPATEPEKNNGSQNDDFSFLSYAVDNWWTHAKSSTAFSTLTSSAEAKSKLDIWFSAWSSIRRISGQETSTTESEPEKQIMCPTFLSNHLQLPIEDCVQLILDANRMQDSPDQDSWSLVTLAASNWGKEEILTKLISRFNFSDSRTLLTMFQTCEESFLRNLLPSLTKFCEDHLEKLLFITIYCEHKDLLNDLVKGLEASSASRLNDAKISLLNVYAASGHLCSPLDKSSWLLESQEILQQIDTSNSTPLHSAAISGNVSLVKTLIQWGIELNRTNDEGETALIKACRYGNYSVVKLLLEAHSHSADQASSRALYEACLGGYPDIVGAFIDHSILWHEVEVDRKTLLHIALERGHSQVATLLLSGRSVFSTVIDNSMSFSHVSDLDKKDGEGKTPLMVAVERNNLPLVKSLMAYHANLDIRDNNGRSAIHYALKYGYFDITVHLLSHMNTRDKEKRRHIFEFLQDSAVRGHVRVLKKLLDKAPPSPEIENDLETALKKAVEWGQTDAARLLLLYYKKRTPGNLVCPAAKSGYLETVTLLLDHGADINAQDNQTDQDSLLHIAAANRYTLLVRSLLLRGAMVNAINAKKQTPLLAAAVSGSVEIVEMLLRAGAQVNITDSHGQTPISSAAFAGHSSILSMLLRASVSRNSSSKHRSILESLLAFAFLDGTNEIFSVVIDHIRQLVSGPRVAVSDATLREFVTTSKYNPKRFFFLETLFRNGRSINTHIGKYGGLLHYAAGWGRLELVEFLIQPRDLHKVDIDMLNKDLNESPLQLAASMCGGEQPALVISKLLAKGANSRLGGLHHGSALHAAVNVPVYEEHERNFSKSFAVVKRLLEHDAQAIHIVAGDYGTVLQSAVIGGNLDIVELLFEHGASREYSGPPSGRHGTPIHAAVYNPENPVLDLLNSLRLQESDIHMMDQEGRLPLHIAASTLPSEVFEAVSIFYKSVRHRDFQGRTALHFAAGAGQAENVRIILNRDPGLIHEADGDGWTALHWACRSSSTSTIQLLLGEGARINEATLRGWLPRDVAAWHDSDGTFMVETTEDSPPPSMDASVQGECDVETNKRVKEAARRVSWSSLESLKTGKTGTWVRCDSCECYIYGTRYTCQTCWSRDYCFKCFRHIKLLQHHKDHAFSKLD